MERTVVGAALGPSTRMVAFDPDRPDILPRFAHRMLVAGRLLAVVTALVGALVLVGYGARSATIVQLAPSLPPMYPNAAVGLVIGGVGVRLAATTSRTNLRVSFVCGALLALLGAVMLALHIVDAGRTVVEVLWPDDPFVAATTPVAGRPVPETCLAFIAAGVAIALLAARRHPLVVQSLALATLTVGAAASLGYAIGVDRTSLGSSFVAVGMALHTALAISALGLATLLVRPTVGLLALLNNAGPGGRVARRLLVVTLAAPLLLAAATALLLDALPDARLAQSIAAVLQVGALGVLVMVPAAGIARFDHVATEATREVRRQREAVSERDLLIDAIAGAALELPASPVGWTLAARQEPAFGELAGDSLLVVDDDPDRFLVAVLDVAGHGTLAAVVAYRLRVEAAALWRSGARVTAIVDQLDRTVLELETIATGVLIAVERATGVLSVVNAGHQPPVVVTSSGTSVLAGAGRLLGVGSACVPVAHRLDHGDLVVVYTDGVSEARDASGAMLGDDAVAALIAAWAPSGPEVVVATCVDAARTHAGLRLVDDALVVALRRD